MDYKEKYEMALDRAKKNYDTAQDLCECSQIGVECFKNTLTNIFPELKESEDERIRKEILDCFRGMKHQGCFPSKHKEQYDSWIAWLEKQGEKSQGKSALEAINEVKVDNQNCVKPADKVEPKFKVCDWIVDHNGKIAIIYDLQKAGYVGHYTDGTDFVCKYSDEYLLHLFTIADAKDGDVLSDGTTIFIFKDLLSDGSVMSYCDYDTDSGESDAFCPLSMNLMCSKIIPATKEQRDLLFSKIQEAGYGWDAKKKELKEIENVLEIPFGAYDSELQEVTYYIPKGFHAEIDDDKVVIKKGEKPATWSEEDEKRLNSCLNILQPKTLLGNTETINTKWLKSLKQRIGG